MDDGITLEAWLECLPSGQFQISLKHDGEAFSAPLSAQDIDHVAAGHQVLAESEALKCCIGTVDDHLTIRLFAEEPVEFAMATRQFIALTNSLTRNLTSS